MKIRLCRAIVSLVSFLAASAAVAQQIPIDANRIVRPVIGETNNYRTTLNVPELTQSAPLTQAAQQYAEFLAANNLIGHTADGRTVQQRILATGAYKPCYYAENVFEYWSAPTAASPATVASAAMQFWKTSPGHAANLRDIRGKHIGVGVAAWTHDGRHYYKVVQVFGDDCGAPVANANQPIPPTSSEIYQPRRPSSVDAIRAALAAPCKIGFVWRVARPSDLVCVTPRSRSRVAIENRIAAARVQPGGGAYGPNTCRPGYVWREAFVGDLVCVDPSIRAFVREENRLHASRVAA